MQNLARLQATMDDYLSEPEDELAAVRDMLLEIYFEINHFLYIYDLLDDHYVKYSLTNEEGDCMVKLYCTMMVGKPEKMHASWAQQHPLFGNLPAHTVLQGASGRGEGGL